MCAPKLGKAEDTLIADSANFTLRMTGPWLILFGGSSLDTALDLRQVETNFAAKVGWRTADVFGELPNAWETLGTQRTTNATHSEQFSLATKTGQMLVQAGVFTALTSAGNPKTAATRLWYSVRDGGWVIARQRVQLTPSGSNVITPIGAPFPCAGVTGLMFALNFTGIAGTIVSPTCLFRPFDSGDPRMPGPWSSTVAALSNVTADGPVNSGNLTTTTAGKMLGQAGFQYSTSGTNPNGAVDILVVAKMS